MPEPNDELVRARKRVESPRAPGQHASRQELAELVNAWVWETCGRRTELDANYIGKLERGLIRNPQEDYRAALRSITGAAKDLDLGFHRRSSREVEAVDRKDFLRAVLGVGAAGVLAGPLSELALQQQATPVPSVVTEREVEAIWTAARVFESWDHTYGGGLVREAVVAQLRHSSLLIESRCPDRLRNKLFAAVGYLGLVCARMAFDACAHDDARRMFRFSQSCSDHAGDWHLRARVLSAMARQAIWCNEPDGGLTLLELAMVRSDRLTPTERAMLHAGRARAHAKRGNASETFAAVGRADSEFAGSEPANDPEWMRYYDEAQHLGDTGHALWDLEISKQTRTEARVRLTAAVAGHDAPFIRSRALSGIKLASLTMVTGDPDEAAAIGLQALDGARGMRSRRAAEDLRQLGLFARERAGEPRVGRLRHEIDEALVAS